MTTATASANITRTCRQVSCDKRLRSDNKSGLCYPHSGWAESSINTPIEKLQRTCIIETCDKQLNPNNKSGYCRKCYRTSDIAKSVNDARVRWRYENDSEFVARRQAFADKHSAIAAERYKTDEAYRQRVRTTKNAYKTRRYETDSDFRERNKAMSRERMKIRSGYAYHIDALVMSQGGYCAICANPFRDTATVDHIHPVSLGGSNDIANLQAACMPCNSFKRDRTDIISLKALLTAKEGA